MRLGFEPEEKTTRVFNQQNKGDKCVQFVIFNKPLSAHSLHYLCSGISVMDSENNETQLKIVPETIISCVSVTVLRSGIQVLTAVDHQGLFLVYAWSDKAGDIASTVPVAKCKVLNDANYICTFPGPKELQFFVGIVNVFNKLVVISLELPNIQPVAI